MPQRLSDRGPVQGLVRACSRVWSSVGLGTKMTAIVIVGVLSLVGLFAYFGTAELNREIQRTLQERVVLAQTTARHMDYALAGVEAALTNAAAQPAWRDPQSADENLAQTFERLKFYASRVFLLDRSGRLISAFPPTNAVTFFDQFVSVQKVLGGQSFAVSRYLHSLDEIGAATLAAAPIRDASGQVYGALVISIDLTGPNIDSFTRPIGIGESGYIDLIDLSGTILTSTRPDRIGQPSDHGDLLATLIRDQRQTVSACHDCHQAASPSSPVREVLAFAPLERAQWGVAIHQSEDEVFAPIRQLQVHLFLLMVVLLAGALVLVYLTTRSVITPVQALTLATQRIAAGDLATPLQLQGKDEIGTLAQSFDAMRARLNKSIAEIQAWNRELDARVRERTAACEQAREENAQLLAELQRKEQLRDELLRRVFSAQEEERKRISRELHDETCQILNALALALDDTADHLGTTEIKPQIERMHDLATTAQKEIQRIVLDLRPTMLDHLGLVPALRWYAESRLSGLGIRLYIQERGEPRRLPPAVETALFRVVQEALNNIARHSRATRADLIFDFQPDRALISIKDNGKGFDPATVFSVSHNQRGLGLMGMEERMSAIGGQFILQSTLQEGTTIQLSVPTGA
jgi:signal transduction histidine kinase